MHWKTSDVVLSKEMIESFFKKRTMEDNVYRVFAKVNGNIDLEDEKYEKCTITFHFTNHEDMVGEIKKYFEYKSGGRNIVSYMKTMIKYLVEERRMKDFGHFCVVVEE